MKTTVDSRLYSGTPCNECGGPTLDPQRGLHLVPRRGPPSGRPLRLPGRLRTLARQAGRLRSAWRSSATRLSWCRGRVAQPDARPGRRRQARARRVTVRWRDGRLRQQRRVMTTASAPRSATPRLHRRRLDGPMQSSSWVSSVAPSRRPDGAQASFALCRRLARGQCVHRRSAVPVIVVWSLLEEVRSDAKRVGKGPVEGWPS